MRGRRRLGARLEPVGLSLLVFASAGALAGCVTPETADISAATLANLLPIDGRPLASYLHDLSEPIPGVSVATAALTHLRIPSTDGIDLDAWLAVPDVGEPVPLVLEVTPYYGGGSPVLPNGLHVFGNPADVLVPRGYAYGIVSVRGTGNSEGCFTIGGQQEAKDTAAVVEALAKEPWSNGRVGIMGVSYPGTTPQDVWVEAPPALKTIVPIAGISDLYKYNFVNGVPINAQGFGFNTYYWAMVGLSPAGLNGGAQALDPVAAPGAIAGEACTDQLEVQEGGVSSTLDGNKDAYWQERDFLAELLASPEKERASVFYVHGLEDWNVKPHHMQDWLPALQATGVPFKAWLGEWGHAWPEPPPTLTGTERPCRTDQACRNDWWESAMVAWFDQFLKEKDTGILDAPAVQVQDSDRVWRHETAWPPAHVEWRTLHPAADGTLGATPGVGDATYHDLAGRPKPLFFDNPAGSREVALFVSEPLDADVHVSGLPVFEADVTASGARASLVLTLIERTPERDRAVNYAAQSLNHVKSLAAGDPDVAGERQHVRVQFFPQDDVLHKGSRIVLAAAGNTIGTTGPELQPVSSGGTITIHLDGATLTLPIDWTIVPEEPAPFD